MARGGNADAKIGAEVTRLKLEFRGPKSEVSLRSEPPHVGSYEFKNFLSAGEPLSTEISLMEMKGKPK
jgi:hypothetical protein